MPARWKLFRALCVLQVVFAGLQAGIALMLSARVLGFMVFLAMVLFAALGLTLVNRNYPDDPPRGTQKTYFNWLYIINFLAVGYLLGEGYVRVKYMFALGMFWIIPLILNLMFLIMFFLQVYLLYMMFLLRRELYANYIKFIDSIGEKIK